MRPPCGTLAAYKAHSRHYELPCAPCLDATADYNRGRSIATGRVLLVRVPIDVARLLLLAAPDDVLASARQELGPRTVAALLAQVKAVTS